MNLNPFFFFIVFGAFMKLIWEIGIAIIILTGSLISVIAKLVIAIINKNNKNKGIKDENK